MFNVFCHGFFALLILTFTITTQADAQESDALELNLSSTLSKFRTTYEDVSLPANEKMGFLGASLLYNITDWLSVGPSGYGALVGQRGGFITLGGTAELTADLNDHIAANAGVFVGAGGGRGGYFLSGGGLMLRYHAGLLYRTENLGHIGLGISYLDFPDGTIHSAQPYLLYEFPFHSFVAPGWVELSESEAPPMGHAFLSENEIAPQFRTYYIPSGVTTDAGTPQHRRIDLMGAEWNHYLNDNLFLRVETEGAMGGKSNGYMQILFGAGYRMMLTNSTWFKVHGDVGVAGGGAVNTGGGFIVDVAASLQQRLYGNIYGELSGGFVKVPETNFRAYSAAAKLGYHFFTPDMESATTSELGGFNTAHARIRTTHQSYLKDAPNWRGHHAHLNVNNLGIQIDAFVHDNIFLTGQGLAAYSGKAGAYMAGLVGGGLHLPLFKTPLFVDAELLAGAAGGGGMAVGGGFVWQSNAGIGYRINDSYSLIAQYGYMAAPKGAFRAKVVTFSLASDMTLFIR